MKLDSEKSTKVGIEPAGQLSFNVCTSKEISVFRLFLVTFLSYHAKQFHISGTGKKHLYSPLHSFCHGYLRLIVRERVAPGIAPGPGTETRETELRRGF